MLNFKRNSSLFVFCIISVDLYLLSVIVQLMDSDYHFDIFKPCVTLFELYKQHLIIVFDKNYRRLTDVCGVVFYGFDTLFYNFL